MRKKSEHSQSAAKRTLISACISIACALALLTFFPDMDPKAKFPESFNAAIHITADGENADDGEISIDELLDYSPMFVTTRWNYSRRQPPPKSEILPLTGSQEHFRNRGIELMAKLFDDAERREMENGRTSLLNSILRNVFTSLGRKSFAEPASSESGIIKLVDLKSGIIVKKAQIPSEISKLMKSIAEFSVSISPDGWANKAIVRESSGSEAADAKLASFLHSSKLLKGLASGDYKAIFAP